MKDKNLCPTCKERPVCEPFVTCQDCFVIEAVCMESFMQIQRDHGMIKALASRAVIEKAVRGGAWKDEYIAEYQTNLERLEQQQESK